MSEFVVAMAPGSVGYYAPKGPGDTVGALIRVGHSGRGGTYYVGFGVANYIIIPNPNPDVGPPDIKVRGPINHFVYRDFTFDSDSSLRYYDIDVSGVWPDGLPDGDYDCFAFVLHPSREMRTDGRGYDAGSWFEDIYTQQEVGLGGISVEYWY